MSGPVQEVDLTPWPEDFARHYRERGYWRGQSLGAFLRERAHQYGERIALICGARRWTYRELDTHADEVAAGLQALGLRAGDRVVVQLPNIAEFFVVCFACFRLGVIPVMALPGHRRAEIASFCAISGAVAYLIAERGADGYDYRQLARELLAHPTSLRHVIVAQGDAAEFIALDTLRHEVRPLPERDAGEIALLQLSGGSTGRPKLIPRTHDDYLYSVRASAAICELGTDTVFLAVLPLAHNFPLSSPGTLGTLCAGGCVVVAPRPDPATAFALIAEHAVTQAALVPALLLSWLDAAASRGRDALASLKCMQVGGASLSPEVAARVRPTLGCALQQVFGMAEGLVNYTRSGDDDTRILHTQGRPISDDDEIRVVDDEDRDVAIGEVGHLLTRGPYTIRGYYRAAEHNARAFTADGFYRTGDRVRRDAQGYIQVVGRAKDQINRGGEKIAAEEVEHQLLTHPQVRNVALVAVPDAFLGERSCAFVELAQPDAQPRSRLALELKMHLRERGIATYKIPDRIEFVDALPLTAPGKVAKQQLRERLHGQAANAAPLHRSHP